MSELVIPRPEIWVPDYKLRLPKWARPWERTKEDVVVEAIARVGSFVEVDNSLNSSSTTIVVPAGASLALVGLSGHSANVNFFSTGTLTLGGTSMTAVGAADASAGDNMSCMYYQINPVSGGSQALAWNWAQSGNPDQGVILVAAFYSGTDTTTPIRDSDGVQTATSTRTSKTLTCVNGDMIIAIDGCFWDASGLTITWTGATKQQDFQLTSGFAGAAASWAQGSPSGNQTVNVVENHAGIDAGLSVVVVKPSTVVVSDAGPSNRHYLRNLINL